MTPGPAPASAPRTTVPVDALVLGPRRGSGSVGTVHEVVGGADDLGFDAVVYKAFGPSVTVAAAPLEALARLRRSFGGQDRARVDAATTWPAAVVTGAGGSAAGYLMQAVPEPFLQEIATLAEGRQRIPREVQHLFVDDALARRNLGEVPTPAERLALAADLAGTLAFLHRHDLVFGDLSYRNAVYALRPRPAVMLLDCDGLRRRGQQAAVRQLHSPGWRPPERGPQTVESDRYKLGLFVLRCLTPGVNAQNRDPAAAAHVLDAAGRALLGAALGDDPHRRPAADEWAAYLVSRVDGIGGVAARSGPVPAAPDPTVVRRVTRPEGRRAGVPASVRLRAAVAGPAAPATVPTRSPRSGVPTSAGPAGPPSGPPPRRSGRDPERVVAIVLGLLLAVLMVVTFLGIGSPR